MKQTNICIIDDNVIVCDALKFLLESFLHFSIKTYTDPILFLNNFSPDWQGCLIIDLCMPEMNGIDLVKEIKKVNPKIPIIIISGYGAAKTMALGSGADAFLTKPFQTDELLEKITHFLQLSQ